MYQFTAQRPAFKVKLHDEMGKPIGYASFADGNCSVDTLLDAQALARAIPGLTEYGIEQVTPFAESEQAVPAEDAPDAGEDDPEQSQTAEPRARRKGGSHVATT